MLLSLPKQAQANNPAEVAAVHRFRLLSGRFQVAAVHQQVIQELTSPCAFGLQNQVPS